MVKHDFTKGSMASGIVRLSLPMILAQLVNVLYNIVDRMYLGHSLCQPVRHGRRASVLH